MIARGNVVLQTTEGWRMTTEELHFLNSRRRITSDRLVRVEKQGSILEGVGFESDPNLEHFEFQHQAWSLVFTGLQEFADACSHLDSLPYPAWRTGRLVNLL